MLTFAQFTEHSDSAETGGIPTKTVKWIYHPKTGASSSPTSSEHHVEHSDLIDNLPVGHPDYDEIHKGKAYVRNGKIHAWWNPERTENKPNNRFNMQHVEAHLGKKYKGAVTWHNNGLEAAHAIRYSNHLKEVEYPVQEIPMYKKKRNGIGYNYIVHIDAKQFKDQFEKEWGGKLDWHPGRMENLKTVSILNQYPLVYRSSDGRLDVVDGRHRITTAANAGKTIRVATPDPTHIPNHLLVKEDLYQEEPGSTFTDDNHKYDLDKIFQYSENIPTESINIKSLDWILGSKITPDDSARISAIHDLTPILIMKKGSRMLVVDGFHRLLKAKRDGLQDILAKVIPQSIMDRCKIDKPTNFSIHRE